MSQKKTLSETALDLLARREHGVAELTQKLVEKGYPKAEVQACVENLQAKNLLSDSRYAAARALYRARSSGWGPSRIRAELTARGVAKEHIDAALESLIEEAAEDAAAQKAARKVANLPREKAMAKLARLGFGWAQAAAIYEKAHQDAADEQEITQTHSARGGQ